jgi:hypothetical protein
MQGPRPYYEGAGAGELVYIYNINSTTQLSKSEKSKGTLQRVLYTILRTKLILTSRGRMRMMVRVVTSRETLVLGVNLVGST